MEDQDFKVPCTARYEWVTPEAAKHMLDTGNRRNRKVSVPPVKRMQGIIKRGEWMYDSTDAVGWPATVPSLTASTGSPPSPKVTQECGCWWPAMFGQRSSR